jgi:RNA polymerase sigma-70 factor (ECF subfamily)
MIEKGQSQKKSEALDFSRIYRDFRPRISRYLAGMVGEAEAEDLTQETFLKVSRGLRNFRGRSRISTWIYRIATNAALDRLKKPSFKHQTSGGTGVSLSGRRARIKAGDAEICADEKSPTAETSVIQDEMVQCLRQFIDKLPVGQRAVAILSFFEGLKNAEIARILGINVQNVKMRLQRARSRLVADLEVHCGWFRDARNHLTWDGKILL